MGVALFGNAVTQHTTKTCITHHQAWTYGKNNQKCWLKSAVHAFHVRRPL